MKEGCERLLNLLQNAQMPGTTKEFHSTISRYEEALACCGVTDTNYITLYRMHK